MLKASHAAKWQLQGSRYLWTVETQHHFKGFAGRKKKLINHAPGVTPSYQTYQSIILEAAASTHQLERCQ